MSPSAARIFPFLLAVCFCDLHVLSPRLLVRTVESPALGFGPQAFNLTNKVLKHVATSTCDFEMGSTNEIAFAEFPPCSFEKASAQADKANFSGILFCSRVNRPGDEAYYLDWIDDGSDTLPTAVIPYSYCMVLSERLDMGESVLVNLSPSENRFASTRESMVFFIWVRCLGSAMSFYLFLVAGCKFYYFRQGRLEHLRKPPALHKGYKSRATAMEWAMGIECFANLDRVFYYMIDPHYSGKIFTFQLSSLFYSVAYMLCAIGTVVVGFFWVEMAKLHKNHFYLKDPTHLKVTWGIGGIAGLILLLTGIAALYNFHTQLLVVLAFFWGAIQIGIGVQHVVASKGKIMQGKAMRVKTSAACTVGIVLLFIADGVVNGALLTPHPNWYLFCTTCSVTAFLIRSNSDIGSLNPARWKATRAFRWTQACSAFSIYWLRRLTCRSGSSEVVFPKASDQPRFTLHDGPSARVLPVVRSSSANVDLMSDSSELGKMGTQSLAPRKSPSELFSNDVDEMEAQITNPSRFGGQISGGAGFRRPAGNTTVLEAADEEEEMGVSAEKEGDP